MTSFSLINSGDFIIGRKQNIHNINSTNYRNLSTTNDRSITTNESSVIPTSPHNKKLIRTRLVKIPRFTIASTDAKTNTSITNTPYTPYNISSHLFSKNKYYINKNYFPPTFLTEEMNSVLDDADSIVKEREKKKGPASYGIMNQKAQWMKTNDEMRTRNYIIRQLREKRIEIGEKERMFDNAVKKTERMLETDYNKFLDFVQENEINKKNLIDELLETKQIRDKKEAEYNKIKLINSKLEQNIEKIMKSIAVTKKYGSFVYKVFGEKFIYDSVPSTVMNKNYRQIVDHTLEIYKESLLSDYNNKEMNEKLKDSEELMKAYKQFEDDVIGLLHEKETMDYENKKIKAKHEEEIDILQKRLQDVQKDEEEMLLERDKIIFGITGCKVYDPNEIDTFLGYIKELSEEIGHFDNEEENGEESTDCIYNCKKALNILRQKEMEINDYINEIENIIQNGDKEDKNLILGLIYETKKRNKNLKQAEIQKKMEEIKANQMEKAIERAQRLVIIGRKVDKGSILPFLKNRNKKVKVVHKNNDMDYLYYFSD